MLELFIWKMSKISPQMKQDIKIAFEAVDTSVKLRCKVVPFVLKDVQWRTVPNQRGRCSLLFFVLHIQY